jgi:cytidylate kinase
MVIAIDGPAGSGKSTIARLLADKFKKPGGKEYMYVNSGNLYRAITLGCLRANIIIADDEKVLEFTQGIKIKYEKDQVFLDGENVTDYLHTDEIDRFSAPLSAIVPIRHIVNRLVRSLADNQNIVVEGRDMTTVVFPNAEYRFYLDASADSRAKRRFEQGVSSLSLDEVKKAILQRDEIDKNKIEGSLRIADGVHYMDTSDLTILQVYEKVIEIVDQR